MNLLTPIESLPNINDQYQKKLKKLGIKTIKDIIFHFPHRYEDFSNIIPISKVESASIDHLISDKPKKEAKKTISIQGEVLEIKNIRIWKKKMVLTEAIVQDNSGKIKVIWFNQSYLINTLKAGDFVCLSGKTARKKSKTYLSSPSFEKIKKLITQEEQAQGLTHTGRLVPIYPATEKLSSKWLRFVVKPLLTQFKKEMPDSLPKEIVNLHNLLPIQKAIWQIHFPDSLELAKKARQRFQFEELFLIMLLVLRKKQKMTKEKAKNIPLKLEVVKSFVDSLPFKLTDSQKKSAWQILKDLEKAEPMNRLLEGDVGSGKTVVATIGILNTIKAGYQVAVMAPTEILAKQHFKTIREMLKSFKLKVGFLTSKESLFQNRKITKAKLIEKTKKQGGVDLLIGTHSLIQEGVEFNKLALAILDEQHRFGVDQRAKLVQKQKFVPHFLSMTATPIPRTLSLTIYGDLDLSLITEMPKGRKRIITKIIPPQMRLQAYAFIKKQVKIGQQVFVICPRIESTNNKQQTMNNKNSLSWSEVKAVKEEYDKLSKKVFPDLKVAMLHGKMKAEEKEKIMSKMKSGKIDILISTSVIEVGIDIPNATIIMIEGAERFGLAQLHQFRGRVGRAKHQSFCMLFTDSQSETTQQRLKALISSENGFKLAEKDLQIRGPGDFIGKRQSGIPDLIMSSLKDLSLVQKTREAAKNILINDPELKKYPLLQKKLKEFEKRVHLE